MKRPFKVGDRLQEINRFHLSYATVTEITDKGFKYIWNKPIFLGARIGVEVGGEVYESGYSCWRLMEKDELL